MQYLYQDGDSYVFMDQENYEQINLSADFLESQSGFLMPEMKVQVNFYNGRPIGIQLPPSVILTVSDTEPGIKNSTATNSFKPATMETGVTVQVPPFINTGDKIKVDTNEGKYMERA
jgi:elongation factor P